MKKNLTKLFLMSTLSVFIFACSSDDDQNPSPTPTPIVYGQIKTHNNVNLGGQENVSIGSFFASDTGLVYKSVEASVSTTLQGKIDLVFFYGTTNGSTIGAPSDATVIFAHTNNTSLPNWTVKNSTLFSSQVISTAKYDSVNNDSILVKLDSASFNMSIVPSLSADKVVAFKTAKGKIGMFKVVSTEGNLASNRAIKINVKVQK